MNVTINGIQYNPAGSISSRIGIAISTHQRADVLKCALEKQMKQAVIDAVRESDLFASLQAKIDAQTASVVGLQQAMHEAVKDALRNALKPGGILWAAISHR